MAILNPNKPGYAVVEINKLQSRTTGNMVANAPLATDFTTNGKDGSEQTYAENGMILFYDPTSKKGNRYGAIVGYPGSDSEGSGQETLEFTSFGLVYATEHMYDVYGNALQNFKMDRPTDPNKEATPYEAIYGQQNHFQYYPRVYMLSSSDTFTTDAIELDEFEDIDDVRDAVAEGPVYVNVQEGGGYSVLATTKTLGQTYGVVEMVTTLPDGITPAIKIRVIGNDVKLLGASGN